MRAIMLLWAVLATFNCFSFERIDGTFYLDRHTATWVIVMRNDKTFEIFGPDGMYSAGRYRSTDDHLTFLEGDQKRRFHYDWKDGDLKFGYREGENIDPNGTLARVPPSRESQNREHYISEASWRGKGRPAFVRPVAGAVREAPPVVIQPQVPANLPPAEVPVAAGGNINAIAGNYYLPAPNNARDLLAIGGDGKFEFAGADGSRASGTVNVLGDELLLASATHQRGFKFRRVAGGLEFTRKDTDVVKAGDPLGKLPPQDREPFTWFAVAPRNEIGELASGTGKALSQIPVGTAPAQQPPVQIPPANNPQPVQPAAVAGNLEFAKILGTYVHKPNPFISETIVISGDGKFSYKDSNGAGAQGVFSVVDGVMTITSGEVVRKFSGSFDGKTLTLNCAPDDAPKFKNDMASMSPTVLKTAKYERQ